MTTNRSVPPSLNVHGSVMQLISQNDGMNRLGANPNISVDESGATAIVVPWVGTVPSWLESGIKAIAAETGSSVTVVSARNTQSEMMLAAAELHSLFPDDARVSTSVEIGIDSLVFRGPALPDVVHASSSPDDDAWAAFMEDAAERIAFDGVGITFVEEESVPEPAM
ncbi:hypothetical protein [Microbacterium natoriense]|uniref:hypothetical protein n=1 Tax=Microbacterium natoriense TaxID=284570 RepID=UPI0027D7B731|nr:hypothetical protein [Microbacterium natoriense]